MSTALRLRQGLVMLLVTVFSLGLLVFVGWGEANRTYPRFQAEKMAAQGELLQTALNTYLTAGLPLDQFPGFRQLAEPIVESDPAVAAIVASDAAGRPVFSAGSSMVPRLAGPDIDGRFAIRQDSDWLQVALPLRSRFEHVGEITVTMPRADIAAAVAERLPATAALAAALALAYGLFAAFAGPKLVQARFPWFGVAFAAAFMAAAAAVVAGLVGLYAEGAQAKAKALAASLGQRLEPVIAFQLDLRDFAGLDRMLDQYRILNPDVQAVAVIVAGRAVVHTDRDAIGAPWESRPGTYEFVRPVGGSEDTAITVAVSLPADIVWRAVAGSAKNFAALFLASGLMAALFLSLARALNTGGIRQGAAALALVRPVLFLAVFVENLTAGFLPQVLRDSAEAWGLGQGAASTAFTAYFVAFLAVLLPAGHAAERGGSRRLIVAGALLAALASLLPVLTMDFPAFVAARAAAGLGQGMLFIGVQAAVLAHAPAGQRTQAAAIIVFGFNGGMISGAAIGSLLVGELTPAGVFALGAAAAALLALYAMAVPAAPEAEKEARTKPFGPALATLLTQVPLAFASLGFLRALLLVGAPAKAVMTGVVVFALPLMLSRMGWEAQDIGQVVMIYAAGVLVASGPVARYVDRTGRSGPALVLGGILSGVGLAAIGAVGLPGGGGFQVPLVVGGIVLIGLAHGFINAPVITYVGQTGAARRLGTGNATALYRMVERIGHVLGPVLAAQLLAGAGQDPAVILWAGLGVLALALVFALPLAQGRPAAGAAR